MLDELPAYPASREEYARWSTWSAERYTAREMQVLRARYDETGEPEDRARLVVAWRAIMGHWAGERTVAPDDAPLITHHFLAHAHTAPPFVMVAARQLTWLCVEVGATSTDVLFLVAAFALPLRDVEPELGDVCWDYLIHAPWQTDALSLKDMILAVDAQQGWRDGRGLTALADARLAAGQRQSARALLEGAALIQARRERIDRISSYRDFAPAPIVQGANLAIVRLAELYREEGEAQVHAREVLKRAAELTRSHALVEHIEARVWDRPFDEAYAWSNKLEHPRQLDAEIDRALAADQPHHARRLAEAVMVRKFGRTWYGSPFENLPAALERFERGLTQGPPQDLVARRAAEHLATLYVRTHHVTQHARRFVHAVAGSIAFTGKGAELHPLREELEWFYNRSDPYHVLRRDARFLEQAGGALSDDERAASDEVERWFSDHFHPEQRTVLDRLARMITSPLVDAARLAGDVPVIEEVCAAAFRLMIERGHELAGDLDAISRQAALIRTQYGHGVKLMEYARQVSSFEIHAGAAVATATSLFLPPGLSLAAHAADLGASLLLAFRAVARIGAVFGRDVQRAEGFQLVADSFAIGLSSAEGEGLLTYLSRGDDQFVRSITIGGVTYGASRLVEYLWVAPHAKGPRPSEQLVRHLARVCGFELERTAVARVIPVVGALISGVSTFMFMRMISEAAIHVAARDALLIKVAE